MFRRSAKSSQLDLFQCVVKFSLFGVGIKNLFRYLPEIWRKWDFKKMSYWRGFK